jgi:glyoxylase-like metal-dependent hydrolase (beta-lactamase superfamily II)
VPIEIAPGVVAVETSVADGKIGAIAGDRVALAVDAGIDDAEGRSVAEAIAGMGHKADRIVYTHAHIDHALGGSVFRGGEIIATPGIRGHMQGQLDAWSERTGESRSALDARLGWPTLVFQGDFEIDLGDRIVRILDTPGHAPGAVSVYVPDCGVLFGGDTVVTGIPPSFKDGDSTTLIATLRKLAATDFEVLVPGHGEIVRGREEVRASIVWVADYLERCRLHVSERYGSVEPDEIVATSTYDEFVGDRLPADRHRMVWRHEQTIRQLIVELSAPPSG